ncbi:MAG TPA: DUF1572 family protein [Terriglobales bacterium]|jgi:uncharacterized damage-inducible protein DinB
MGITVTTSYVKDITDRFRYYKRQAERAMEQIPDPAFFATLGPESNSIAVLIKHLSGNMRSRWTDFLTTDGEKPDRDYNAEFREPPKTRDELMALWEAGWNCALNTLNSLTDEHLSHEVSIRSEAHSVMQAINRQVTHASYHVGQIVYLAKHFAGGNWKSLTASHGKPAGLHSSK